MSSVANTDPSSLNWEFVSVNAGDQFSLIRYSVDVDPKLTTRTFINTATLNLDIETASDLVSVKYQLNILANFGLHAFKIVDYPVHGMNEPFELLE